LRKYRKTSIYLLRTPADFIRKTSADMQVAVKGQADTGFRRYLRVKKKAQSSLPATLLAGTK
jgi:hypothetical protein